MSNYSLKFSCNVLNSTMCIQNTTDNGQCNYKYDTIDVLWIWQSGAPN